MNDRKMRRCARCHQFFCHPGREYAICLDCLIRMLAGPTGVVINESDKSWNQPLNTDPAAFSKSLEEFDE